jgi:hypothetical protein
MRNAAITIEKAYMLVPRIRWKYLDHVTSRSSAAKPETKRE